MSFTLNYEESKILKKIKTLTTIPKRTIRKDIKKAVINNGFFCGPTWVRTRDPLLVRQVL